MQFYYEPGTNKQFRSIKEVNKHLESKQKKIQLTTPLALPENHRHNPETPPVVDLACVSETAKSNLGFGLYLICCLIFYCVYARMQDCGSNIPKKKRSIAAKQRGEISRNDHQELESPPAIDPSNVRVKINKLSFGFYLICCLTIYACMQDSGSNLPRKKRSVDTRKRREITWGFADAETGKRKNLDLNKIR